MEDVQAPGLLPGQHLLCAECDQAKQHACYLGRAQGWRQWAEPCGFRSWMSLDIMSDQRQPSSPQARAEALQVCRLAVVRETGAMAPSHMEMTTSTWRAFGEQSRGHPSTVLPRVGDPGRSVFADGHTITRRRRASHRHTGDEAVSTGRKAPLHLSLADLEGGVQGQRLPGQDGQ